MGETILMWVVGGIRHLVFYLDEIVYGFIVDLYDIFRYICGIRITNNAIMNELSTRIGWILGLIMFFYISFDFVQILLDPDKISDKDKGPVSIIKKFLIVIVLLGTSRYIFDLMYNFQDIVLNNDNGNGSIIEKLILPFKVNTSSFGRAITVNFMYNFYTVDDLIDYEIDDSGDVNLKNVADSDMEDYSFSDCIQYTHIMYTTIQNEGSFAIGSECLVEKFESDVSGTTQKKFFIDFNLISLPVGLFVAWTLLMYCVSVGMRVIQLAVLQIISPAAIICYLSPNKENTFIKWFRIYVSTYIDVFIRIAIIDFVVLLSGLILEFNQVSTSGVSLTSKMEFWAQVFMILALLSFAKKAPELFNKLLPDKLQSGLSLGFGTKDRAGLGILGGALGFGTGIAVGGAANAFVGAIDRGKMAATLGKNKRQVAAAALSGLGGGLFRGARYGLQNKGNFMKNIPAGFKAQHDSDVKYEQLIASGGSMHGVLGSKVGSHFGETKGQTYNRRIADLDKMDQFKKDMYAAADEAHEVKSAKDTWEHMTYNAQDWGGNMEAFESAKSDAYDRYRNLRNSFADAAIRGEETYLGGSMDDDDKRYAADILATVSSANAYSKSHSVKRWDKNTDQYVDLGEIRTRSALADASNYAHETKTHIVNSSDYASSIAEDEAAGVSKQRNYGGK